MGMYCMVRAVGPDEIEQMLSGREEPPELPPGGRGASLLSLEKAWHGLHFLLTGSVYEGEGPLGFLLQGGEAVGEDEGYGPPRILRPEDVARLDDALAGVTDDVLWDRFDPARMEEEGVYPGIWDEPEAGLREEYLGYFHELKKLVREAAAGGKGLFLLLS